MVARIPLKPVRFALDAYAAESLHAAVLHAFADPVARAALFVATPSLYQALVPALDAGSDVPRRVLLRALRYIVRMSTRCTPFGLFAAVAAVPAGSDTTLAVIPASRASRTRIDMAVIERLVSELEKDHDHRAGVVVFTNDFVKRRGSALMIYGNALDRTSLQSQVLHRTALIESVETIARDGVRIGRLLELLQAELRIDTHLANSAVDILLDAGALITDVRSSLGRFDDRAVLRRYAAASPARAAAVAAVTGAVSNIDSRPVPEQRAAHYTAVRDAARTSFGDADHYFQTDSKVALSGTLGAMLLDDAACMAELLARSRRPPSMTEIVRRFAATYEGDVLVPLIDLEESAILEDALEISRRVKTHSYTDEGNARLLAVVSQAAAARQDVRLERHELLRLFAPCEPGELPAAVEIGFQVFAADVRAVNSGEYVLAPAPYTGSDAVGKTMGRFLHMMPEVRGEIRAWHRARSQSGAKALADVLFLPPRMRAGNVCASARILPYDIQVGLHDASAGTLRLDLADLFVGVRNERFFLWSASLQREVEPYRQDNLATVGSGADIVTFLAMLRTDGVRSCSTFSLGDADALPYVPRVCVDRIVLAPARWHVHELGGAAAQQEWRAENAVPRFVWISDRGDHRLLVDLDSPSGKEQLDDLAAAAARESKLLKIEEALGIETAWLPGTDGTYAAEFVASLELVSAPTHAAAPARRYFDRGEAVAGPDEGWLFFKLYCEPKLQNFVLRTVVRDVLADLRATGTLGSWFFLRYVDPLPHLRLRLRIADRSARERCATMVWERLSAAVKARLLNDVSQSTYRRELERYGGTSGVELAEELFDIDSDLAIEQLARGEDAALLFRAAVDQAYRFVTGVLSADGLQGWLGQLRGRRKKLGKDDWQLVRDLTSLIAEPRPALEARLAAAERRLAALPLTAEVRHGFVNAVAHMHFNRYGISGAAEERASSIVWRLCSGVTARAHARQRVAEVSS